MLRSDWSDGDIVFVASLCFSETLIRSIFEEGRKLKAGAKLITCHRLPSSDNVEDIALSSLYSLEQTVPCRLSWGWTDFFVLVRR